MKHLKISFYIICIELIFIGSVFAEADTVFINAKHRVGFVAGAGVQKTSQLFDGGLEVLDLGVHYDYQVKFFQLQYYRQLHQKSNWSIEALFQPQFNTTRYKTPNTSLIYENGYEFGINVGFLYRKVYFDDLLSLYCMISSGPHYISGAHPKQVPGFIFSDSFIIGANVRLYQDLYLDLRPGFRHISNANLKKPNKGVNTMIFSTGILYNL